MDGEDTRTGYFHEVNRERSEIRGDVLDPVVAAIHRTCDSSRRLEAAHRQAVGVRKLLVAQIRDPHPAWTDEEVREEVWRRFLGQRG